MKEIYNKQGFLYVENNIPKCWFYAKMSQDKLKKALPLSDTENKTHLIAFFVNGTDYLGCAVENDIPNLIEKFGEIPINNDSTPKDKWEKIYNKEFYEMKKFILEQLNSIEKCS